MPFPCTITITITIDIQYIMFNEAQNISISGNATNIVYRDQYNRASTIINRIVRVERPGRAIVKKGKKRHDIDSAYNQYREIIRGDIHKLEQLRSVDDWGWEDGDSVQKLCRRTVHRAQVYGDDRVFTAISFNGRDAEEIWKKEFMKWSQADDPAVLLQLFAINRSKIPTLLFYDEWLPFLHLYTRVKETFWEGYYLRVYTRAWQQRAGLCSATSLKNQLTFPQIKLNSLENQLWLNSRTGRVSSGPNGPFAGGLFTSIPYNCEDMPSAMEMATADTCVRFFNQTGAGNLDFHVSQYAWRQRSFTCIQSLLGIDSPDDDHTHKFWRRSTRRGFWYCNICDHIACDEVQDFIGKLRFDTVYSGAQLDKIAILKEGPAYTWDHWSGALSDQILIDNGLTRFRFQVGSYYSSIHFSTRVLGNAWVLQAHRLNLSTSGSETCFIPCLRFDLHLKPRRKQFGVSDLEILPIVYLFLRPPALCLADIDSWLNHVSFWSFDKNGTSEISEMECKRLGLPYIASDEVHLNSSTWSKYTYDGIHAWQVARGFDPATADFARSLDLPIFEPAITRFENVVEEEPLTRSSPPEPDANSIHFDPDDPSASSQLSPLPTPAATRIPQRRKLRKRKQARVVIIHDTDSESEPESHQHSTLKGKRVKVV
uniref:Uncharacterized protein n=1 Tax=Moniliophthora roreri TaxID=221103 RepID=A0A0W0FII7_MONRR